MVTTLLNNQNITKVLLVHISYIEIRNILGKQGFDISEGLQLTILLLIIFSFTLHFPIDNSLKALSRKYNTQEYSMNQNYMESQPQIILTHINEKRKLPNQSQASIFMHEKVLQSNIQQIQCSQNLKQEENKQSVYQNSTCKTFTITENQEIPSQFEKQNSIFSCNNNINSDLFNFFSTGLLIIDDQKKIISQNRQFLDIIQQFRLLNQNKIKQSENLQSLSELQQLLNLRIKYNIRRKQKKQNSLDNNSSQYKSSNISYKEKSIQEKKQKFKSSNVRQFEHSEHFSLEQQEDKLGLGLKESAQNKEFALIQDLNNSYQQFNSQKDDQEIERKIEKQYQSEQQINVQNINQNIFLNKLSQCNLSEIIKSFFASQIDDVTIGDLLDFILYSSPQLMKDTHSKVQLEPYKMTFSPQNKKKFSQIRQSQQKLNRDLEYQYTIINEYLVISLLRLNNENKKQIIEFKIGCFQFDDIPDSNDQIKTSLKCIKDINNSYQQTSDTYLGINNSLFKNQPQTKYQTQRNKLTGQIENKGLNQCSEEFEGIDVSVLNDQMNIQPNRQNISYEPKRYFFTFEITPVSLNFNSIINKKISKLKSKIFYQISLDLITPLNCTINMLDLINQRDEIPELIKNIYINPAVFSTYILLNIVNDFHDFSEVNQPGKVSMIYQDFSLSNLCLECLNFIKPQAQLKSVELEFFSNDDVPQLIYSDIGKTRLLLINLLNNALKNTQKGFVSINLSSSIDKLIQIDVKDTGCGIPQDNLNQMFQNITQQSQQYIRMQSNKQKDIASEQSMSQGLYVSYFLSTCLGEGKQLSAISECGKGSVFTFYIANKSPQKRIESTYRVRQQENETNRVWVDLDVYFQSMKLINENDKKQEQNLGQELRYLQSEQQENIVKKDNDNMDTLDVDNKAQKQQLPIIKKSQQKIGFTDYYTELMSANKSQDDFELTSCNSASQSQNYFELKKKNVSSLTINMIRQTSFIYSQMFSRQYNLSQETSRSIMENQSTSKFYHQEVFKQLNTINPKYSNFNLNHQTSLNQLTQKERLLYQKEFQTQLKVNQPEDKIQQQSITYISESNQKDGTEQQFTKFKKEIYGDDSQLQAFNLPFSNFNTNDIESCNVESEIIEKCPINTFFSPKIAHKNYKKKDQLKISPNQQKNNNNFPFFQYLESKQLSQSNNETNNSINNSVNNNKVSQIILNSESSLNNSEINVGDKKSQLLYFNFSCCNYNNEDIKNNLISINKLRQCNCTQILIVDDNDFNLITLELRLKQYLFIVEKASNGQQALDLIKQKSFNMCCKTYSLIFLDIDMPIKNGYEITKDIIHLCSQLQIKVPPISAWTVLIQEQERLKAFNTGMSYYLTKPINQQAFENILFEEFIQRYNEKK